LAVPCNENEEDDMKRLSTYPLAIAILGATAMLAVSTNSAKPSANAEARIAADGAFRDGLYLGKLSAESGQPLRPTVGRWSTDQDRAMFAAGYHRGYSESVASAHANAEHAQATE
jgi:hypothetical protein